MPAEEISDVLTQEITEARNILERVNSTFLEQCPYLLKQPEESTGRCMKSLSQKEQGYHPCLGQSRCDLYVTLRGQILNAITSCSRAGNWIKFNPEKIYDGGGGGFS
ncbi:MAG: hypothetical protein WC254_06095 [Candidatus Woesearchaeota archaeon]|jgi:hypothetical protein